MHWGVDSVTPLNQQVRYRRRRPTLYEHICDYVRRPVFYGRYLNDDDVRRPGDPVRRSRLRASEIDYISRMGDNRPRLLLIYNDQNFMRQRYTMLEDPAVQDQEARRNGVLAAQDAITRLEAIAREANVWVPDNVCIYADLERWTVARAWMAGWMEVMHASRFYGCGGLYWNCGENAVREAWEETVLHGFEDVHARSAPLRQALGLRLMEGSVLGGIEETVPLHKRASLNIWTNRRYLNVRFRRREDADGNVIRRAHGTDRWLRTSGAPDLNDVHYVPTDFSRAEEPPHNFLSRTCIWQYGASMPLGTGAIPGYVDMNLATDHGIASMWQL